MVKAAPNVIEFKEATYLTLPLTLLNINDIDLVNFFPYSFSNLQLTLFFYQGIHATYQVSLTSQNALGLQYEQPFIVIPNKGYKDANFTITIGDTEFLDYEDLNWQEFKITVNYSKRFEEKPENNLFIFVDSCRRRRH